MAGPPPALHGVQFAIAVHDDWSTGSLMAGEMQQQSGPEGGFSNSSLSGNMVYLYDGAE